MTTAQLRRHIVSEFRSMKAATYEYHPLAAFFEPMVDNHDNCGYVPKMYTVNGRQWTVFQIDHVLAKYWNLVADSTHEWISTLVVAAWTTREITW